MSIIQVEALMADIESLRCVIGGCSFTADAVSYTCRRHGELGTLDILYDYEALRANLDRDALTAGGPSNCWRYKALLPLAPESKVAPLSVGWTPLYDSPRIASSLGIDRVWVKDDGANPTGSLKDRASALVLARALQAGIDVVSTASTGNAAAALAGLGASLPEIDTVIFVPATAPAAKVAQLLVYGAQVLLVDGSYDDAFELCQAICQEQAWYSRNTGVNPFTTEGKKTVALEIAEQLRWHAPDVLVVSVGDGSIISGVHKGFSDLMRLGWIDKMPRLIGVQAEGSAVLAEAFAAGLAPQAIRRKPAQTLADSIVAELPRDRAKALRAVRESGGAFVTVSDAAITAAIPRFAQLSGVFAEPAAAAAFAGLERAVQTKIIHTLTRAFASSVPATALRISIAPASRFRVAFRSPPISPPLDAALGSAGLHMSARPVYSIVAPVYNEVGNLRRFYAEVVAALDSTGERWELLLVDDGSSDGSHQLMQELAAADSRLSVIGLARNFGHQIAVTAGVDYARGQAVILIDADLQDPPAVIPRLIDKWKEGFHVVYAVRSERRGESFLKRFSAKLFYRMIHRITEIDIPVDTGDFRLMDEQVAQVLRQMREHHRFVRGMTSWVGFKQTGVEYVREQRAWGVTKYPLRKMIAFALDAVTSFSFFSVADHDLCQFHIWRARRWPLAPS